MTARPRLWLVPVLVLVFSCPAALRAQPADGADAAWNRAVALQKEGKIDAALEAFRQALARYEIRDGKDSLNVAETAATMSAMLIDNGRPREAVPLARRAFKIYEARQGQNSDNAANMIWNLALCAAAVGDHDESITLFRRCLLSYQATHGKDHVYVAMSLAHIGQSQRALLQFSAAENTFLRALAIYQLRSGKDSLDVALVLYHLGWNEFNRGDYHKARDYLQRGTTLYEARQGKQSLDVADMYQWLGRTNSALGDYDRAEQDFRRSIAIRQAKLGKEAVRTADVEWYLAELYLARKQPDRAEPLLRSCLAVYEKQLGKDHYYVGWTHAILGQACLETGRHAEAKKLYLSGLALMEPAVGKNSVILVPYLRGLARVEQLNEFFDAALEHLDRALRICETGQARDHPDTATVLFDQAALLASQKKWREAADRAERASRIQQRFVSRTLPALADQEQLAFLANKHEPALHSALSIGFTRREDAALSAGWLLNGKAVAQQALAERVSRVRDAGSAEVVRLRDRLGTVRREMARLALTSSRSDPTPGQGSGKELAREEEELVRQLTRVAGQPDGNGAWVELDSLRKAIPPGTVFIDIARFRHGDFGIRLAHDAGENEDSQRYAAWVVPPAGKGDVRIVDLGPAQRVDAAVRAVRKAMAEAPTVLRKKGEAKADEELRPHLDALAKQVLWPLVRDLGKTERWVLSPDSLLWLVPWGALPLEDGAYAIEKYHLSYAVSGRDLLAPSPEGKPGQALVLADPDYDLGRRANEPGDDGPIPRMKRLPGTAAEAKAVTPFLTKYLGNEPRVLTDREATEKAVKSARRPAVLLLSTHGFFLAEQESRRENPLLRCGLLLAGANRRGAALDGADEDGVLTGLEIVGTDLRGTDLVVLSACETGVGQVRNGEGVAGLRQAFQLAGARAVVGSLWPVPDADTAALMGIFFERLAAGEGKADALRSAQLARIKARRDKNDVAHPFFWAAFTLTGRPQ